MTARLEMRMGGIGIVYTKIYVRNRDRYIPGYMGETEIDIYQDIWEEQGQVYTRIYGRNKGRYIRGYMGGTRVGIYQDIWEEQR